MRRSRGQRTRRPIKTLYVSSTDQSADYFGNKTSATITKAIEDIVAHKWGAVRICVDAGDYDVDSVMHLPESVQLVGEGSANTRFLVPAYFRVRPSDIDLIATSKCSKKKVERFKEKPSDRYERLRITSGSLMGKVIKITDFRNDLRWVVQVKKGNSLQGFSVVNQYPEGEYGKEFTGEVTGVRVEGSDCVIEDVHSEGYFFNGFELISSENITFRRCVADGVAHDGWSGKQSGGFDGKPFKSLRCTFYECRAIGTEIGFDVQGAEQHLINCYASGAREDGFRISGPKVHLTNCTAEDCVRGAKVQDFGTTKPETDQNSDLKREQDTTLLIDGCNFYDCKVGVTAGGARENSIRDNSMVKIVNSTFVDNKVKAIQILPEKGGLLVISDNTFHRNKLAIEVEAREKCTPETIKNFLNEPEWEISKNNGDFTTEVNDKHVPVVMCEDGKLEIVINGNACKEVSRFFMMGAVSGLSLHKIDLLITNNICNNESFGEDLNNSNFRFMVLLKQSVLNYFNISNNSFRTKAFFNNGNGKYEAMQLRCVKVLYPSFAINNSLSHAINIQDTKLDKITVPIKQP